MVKDKSLINLELYKVKISVQNEGEINAFLDKQKLEEYLLQTCTIRHVKESSSEKIWICAKE